MRKTHDILAHARAVARIAKTENRNLKVEIQKLHEQLSVKV